MTPNEPRLLDEAIDEARAAYVWYRSRSRDAANAFILELDHALEQITASPERWPAHLHGTRRFLLRRHFGEVVRFELSAPEAKTVELAGNFASRPIPATRSGESWVVELPLSEGRYIWQWRVDGQAPNDDATLAAVNAPPAPGVRAGIRVVKPAQRMTDAYPR